MTFVMLKKTQCRWTWMKFIYIIYILNWCWNKINEISNYNEHTILESLNRNYINSRCIIESHLSSVLINIKPQRRIQDFGPGGSKFRNSGHLHKYFVMYYTLYEMIEFFSSKTFYCFLNIPSLNLIKCS